MAFKPTGGGDTSGADARAEEDRRKAAAATEVANVEDVFSSFNPEYWAGQTTDLESRFVPQVDTAFSTAKTNLLNDLASRGQSKESSVFKQGFQKLDREDAVVRENLTSSILDAISGAEGEVLNRKQNLINTINAASDPGGAGVDAATIARSMEGPVNLGFDMSGAFRNYQDMQSIGDLIKSSNQKTGGVQMFGGKSSAGKVVQ